MGPMTEGEAMFWRMEAERRGQSDRPSPRGGGRADVTNVTHSHAVARAKALIAMAERGDLDAASNGALAAWIGRATVVLEELTRDA